MYDQIEEDIENIANNFDKIAPEVAFMKEKITDFYFSSKFKINFDACHVAISKNGGLMAICKKNYSYLDTQRNSKLNDNILVMSQNARKLYPIPISWNMRERLIVSFDFTDRGKLYGICNDGTIYKFDILLKQAREIPSNKTFNSDQIIKAKFIEDGFVALTRSGTFYYVKEFKNIIPISIFQIESLLEFSNDVDFVAIPSSVSKSRKLELIFTNQKGNGVIHVMEQPKGFNYSVLPIETKNGNDLTINGVSILEKDELEPYIKPSNDIISTNIKEDKEDKDDNDNINNIEDGKMGKIVAMAISPLYSKVAFYNNKGIAYLFNSQFDSPKKQFQFQINEKSSETEKNEQKSIIKFDNEYQFLFCGEDSIALSGQRFILITNDLNKTLVYKVVEGEEMWAMQGGAFSKCISEVDGLRYATNEGIFFISKVDQDLYRTCYPFSTHPAKNLLKAYKIDLMKEANSYEEIYKMYKYLSSSILVLANASANIYWTEEQNEDDKKALQLYILKAAQLGKYFVDVDDFRLEKYVDICRNIRIINEIRNNKESPIFITYKEFELIQYKELIKNIMFRLNFKLAYRLSKYLGYSSKKIYQKWACSRIRKLGLISTKEEQIDLYNDIMEELKNIKKISFIKLAKKAFKCKQNELGMKFLELEKSVLAKIPQYLTHKKWDKALKFSYETYDSDIIATCLNEIAEYSQIDEEFINRVKGIKNLEFSVVDYLKKNRPIYIEKYLEAREDFEELMFFMIENFFTSNKIEEKKKYIKLAKEYQKKIDKTNVNNKFYLMYITELNKSIKFKKECMDVERNIIKKSYIEPFDNSIYDCYKLGVKENQLKWIEGENKNYELNSKKMAVMRIRTMAENGKIDMIEQLIKDNSLKKLNLTPLNLAELYFDYKKYDLATEYIKQINNPEYFDYKVDMLIFMEKYDDALEIIISSKNIDRIPFYINEILNKKPNLQDKVKDLCSKYKVNLN